MSGGTVKPNERDLQMICASAAAPLQLESRRDAVPPMAPNAVVEYTGGKLGLKEEEEDLEVKLRRIIEHVPVRVSNTSGSSAGSGSGDFHQYRQMRRREQDRLTRMDVDYQRRKELAEFNMRREERLTAAEERTAKKRLKRQKKKQRKKEKKSKTSNAEEGQHNEDSSESEKSDDGEELRQ
ncbi:hypothetical protein QJS10_CPB13g00507 [Acorus calamus]|uniref:PRKR-interacting protein 1 n=1 Tax=Acorus calamus TaxID=4465 RepID=A0AAV9DE21_ACOCL|nr:hypothetical protein QJS10_CPB13g00507 [Acorus calamus]